MAPPIWNQRLGPNGPTSEVAIRRWIVRTPREWELGERLSRPRRPDCRIRAGCSRGGHSGI